MKIAKITALVGAFALAISTVNAGENLLKNSELKIKEGTTRPQSWSGPKIAMSNETTDLPPGATNALKIEIKKAEKYNGYIGQKIKLTEPNMQFKVSVMVKSSVNRIAHIQVKLFKNNKELKRITENGSKLEWAEITKSFTTFDADELQVLCRFKQDEKSIGQTVWFTNVKLEKIPKQ